jgi:protein CpxP
MLNHELISPQETSVKKHLILPAALLFALGASTALSTTGAFAQDATTQPSASPAAPAGAPAHPQHQRTFHSHIDGRIAYLKAELKITPAQEPQFDKVAQAMRDNANDRQKSFQDMRAQHGKPHNAVDALNTRIKMSQDRAQSDQRLLAAFKPLYDSLTPDQKKVADDLAAPHHFGNRGPGGPGTPHRG